MGSHTSHDSQVKRLYANAEAEIEAEIVVDELRANGHDDEFYESELLPVFGTCSAIYAFEGDFDFDFIQLGLTNGDSPFLTPRAR